MSAQQQILSATVASGGIVATGGTTIIQDGDYKVHFFQSAGTFTVVSGSANVRYLVVGGGGGSKDINSGGGGGGGVKQNAAYDYPVVAGAYTVTVAAGGWGNAAGGTSSFDTINVVGGGYGSGYNAMTVGGNGSSGGGGAPRAGAPSYAGGTGTAGQGYAGGIGSNQTDHVNSQRGGGGGGAGGVGDTGLSSGNGGVGVSSDISGMLRWYGSGGGAGCSPTGGGFYGSARGRPGLGGTGWGLSTNNTDDPLSCAAPYTGDGAGGNGYAAPSNSRGGSGIVAVRYLSPMTYGPPVSTDAALFNRNYLSRNIVSGSDLMTLGG